MSYAWLPEVLAEIAEAAGLDAALQIAEEHGGTRMSFPAFLPEGDHWLTTCVGREAAEKLCAHFRQGTGGDGFGGAYVLIPRGPTGAIAGARRRMAKVLREGGSAADAARAAALLAGRDYVLPDEVRSLAMVVLPHRLVTDAKSRYSGVTSAQILQEIIQTVKIPR